MYTSVFVLVLISFSLHLVMSVLMHAELLLSDPIMFAHIRERAALYPLCLLSRRARHSCRSSAAR